MDGLPHARAGAVPVGAVPVGDRVAWWKTAVVYQVYIRSFADADGNGLGDIAGLRDRLPYLATLGVDALWVNPWYPSPMEDAGYDVADYRDIEPAFGTLAEAEDFIGEAHAHGLKVILDIVPNHTSAAHVWFEAALAGDLAARERYIFRPGRGVAGERPPNNWQSMFGGTAWTRTTDAAGAPADWYLHLFAPGQPDLNWASDEVRAEFEDILRFWFDREVDGFRIDVAHGLSKAAGLPDADQTLPAPAVGHLPGHPAWDQDEVHAIYQGWRKVADSYDPPRVFVAEAWVTSNERLAQYLRPDELHTAFQFDLLRAPWRADVLRTVIDDATVSAQAVSASNTWVLSNHDVVRHVTRYARTPPADVAEAEWLREQWGAATADLEMGRRRARAAIMLTLALPGTAYLYQGEELGLEEVEDIPGELRQDPTWWQSGFTQPGRDGCRVPLPWSGGRAPFGFSPDGALKTPWLPQPAAWAELAVQVQDAAAESMLNHYRAALRLRTEYLHGLEPLSWIGTPEGVLAFRRGAVQCWVNCGEAAVTLPSGRVLLASGSGPNDGVLPRDTAVWLVH